MYLTHGNKDIPRKCTMSIEKLIIGLHTVQKHLITGADPGGALGAEAPPSYLGFT